MSTSKTTLDDVLSCFVKKYDDGLENFNNSVEQHFLWMQEVLIEAKKKFASPDPDLLPKTPSAKRRRGRVNTADEEDDDEPPSKKRQTRNRKKTESSDMDTDVPQPMKKKTSTRARKTTSRADSSDDDFVKTPPRKTSRTRSSKNSRGSNSGSTTRSNRALRDAHAAAIVELDNEVCMSPVVVLSKVIEDSSAKRSVRKNIIEQCEKTDSSSDHVKVVVERNVKLNSVSEKSGSPFRTNNMPRTPNAVKLKQTPKSSVRVVPNSPKVAANYSILSVKAKAQAYQEFVSAKTPEKTPKSRTPISVRNNKPNHGSPVYRSQASLTFSHEKQQHSQSRIKQIKAVDMPAEESPQRRRTRSSKFSYTKSLRKSSIAGPRVSLSKQKMSVVRVNLNRSAVVERLVQKSPANTDNLDSPKLTTKSSDLPVESSNGASSSSQDEAVSSEEMFNDDERNEDGADVVVSAVSDEDEKASDADDEADVEEMEVDKAISPKLNPKPKSRLKLKSKNSTTEDREETAESAMNANTATPAGSRRITRSKVRNISSASAQSSDDNYSSQSSTGERRSTRSKCRLPRNNTLAVARLQAELELQQEGEIEQETEEIANEISKSPLQNSGCMESEAIESSESNVEQEKTGSGNISKTDSNKVQTEEENADESGWESEDDAVFFDSNKKASTENASEYETTSEGEVEVPETPLMQVNRTQGLTSTASSGRTLSRTGSCSRPANLVSSVSSFIKQKTVTTPNHLLMQQKQALKKQQINKKRLQDDERIKRLKEEKQQKLKEEIRRREERMKLVQQKKQENEKKLQEKNKEAVQKVEKKVSVSSLIKEKKERLEKEKARKLREKKIAEANERRRFEEEARLQKLKEKEEQERRYREMIERKKKHEEMERLKRIEEERIQAEEKRRQLEEERMQEQEKQRIQRLEEEKERMKLKEERDRQLAIERAEREKAELEKQREKERKEREEKEREKEQLRLQLQKETEKKNRAKKEEDAIKKLVDKHNASLNSSSATSRVSGLTTSKPVLQSYDISDIHSSDTDEEEAPRKEIPKWATGSLLKAALIHQHYHPPDLNELGFDNVDKPDLTVMFKVQRTRFKKRTSSANWGSPLYKSPQRPPNRPPKTALRVPIE
ncbi:uncharacterized protein LOC141915084 [Tubulanus polymorphus]|uniref:uncharacterized protein LOC141915084 n=1 Tax=Tubulanus polymorphus TaxID=672921 RepID=UPI003DA21583